MDTTKQSKVLIILSGIGRYALGLILLLFPPASIFFKTHNLTEIIIPIITFPVSMVFAPPMLIGLYFMMTGKFRARIDITLLLIAIFLDFLILGFK